MQTTTAPTEKHEKVFTNGRGCEEGEGLRGLSYIMTGELLQGKNKIENLPLVGRNEKENTKKMP